MNAGPCWLGSGKPTCKGLGAESSCANPCPCGEEKWWGNVQVRLLQGWPVHLGSLAVIAGGQGLKAGPVVLPAPTNPFGNPFRKASCLLNQIPAVFQVLLLTAGTEASQTHSALDAFAPGASWLTEPRRADGT